LFELVLERLRAEIASGTYLPGTHLPSERALMAQFNVGRSAVREALFALQENGEILIRSGERALVLEQKPRALVDGFMEALRPIVTTDDGMRHFQEVRILIEGALARRAALLATAEEVAAIEAALRQNEEAHGDPEQLHRSDVEFHLAIARVGDNPVVTAMNDAVNTWLHEQRRTSVVAPEAAAVATRWHARIFEAIAARDPDAAMAAMESHLRLVQDFYWKVRAIQQDLLRLESDEVAALDRSGHVH
jgi:DNA-binding FadR family transcriptional regulator